MKKVISILTATRAEYGLLKSIITGLTKNDEFDVRVVVTGAHLLPEFGLTFQEIVNDGIAIDEKIEILLSGDTPSSISKSMGVAMINFADYFSRIKPDILILLGDRYETLAVAMTAMNLRIPIAHIHGGETTEGAIDEVMRHAITKLSYWHFTSTDTYRNRVIQLGENPDRVFCVGSLGVENALNEKLLSKSELEDSIFFSLDTDYAVVTYHPETLDGNVREHMTSVLDACEMNKKMKFIFTKANADAGGRIINGMIDEFVANNTNCISFTSLGMVRYLSALKYCSMVIGNSSSGIIEAPSFGVPTINIGDRQKGRIQSESVINCTATQKNIGKAIELALSDDFKNQAKGVVNPYSNDNTTEKIVDKLTSFLMNEKIDFKKKFFDIEVG